MGNYKNREDYKREVTSLKIENKKLKEEFKQKKKYDKYSEYSFIIAVVALILTHLDVIELKITGGVLISLMSYMLINMTEGKLKKYAAGIPLVIGVAIILSEIFHLTRWSPLECKTSPAYLWCLIKLLF